MSPEQFAGQRVDKRSDLFSAGVILYHMLTGEKPFPGNSMTTIMHRVMNTDPPLVSDLNFQVPSQLDAVILKALAKKPDQRYQSAMEFKAALAKALKASSEDAKGKSVEATVMLSGKGSNQAAEAKVSAGSSEPTENIPAEEMGRAANSSVANDEVNLEQKFERIVDLLESKGVAIDAKDRKLYRLARAMLLSFLVAVILSGFGYAVWMIYTEDLTYPQLEQIAIEKAEDIYKYVSGEEIDIQEITQSLKSKPSKEFPDRPDPREEKEQSDVGTASKIPKNKGPAKQQ
jgi:serine/threonine protein kinase